MLTPLPASPERPRKAPVVMVLTCISLVSGCGPRATEVGTGGQTAFRVRSDFGAALNSDQGWAGALNENVTIHADRPFRIRFEVEPPPGTSGLPFRLQSRRNKGEWTAVEAHDFPYPERELDLEFEEMELGESPRGWRVEQGNAAAVAVAMDAGRKVLRAQVGREPLIGLHAAPWDVIELAAEFRLPSDTLNGVGFVFAYADSGNYCRLFLDAAAGSIRVSRFVDGVETSVTEQEAGILLGEWLEVEVDLEDDVVEVNFEDDTLEFTTDLGAGMASTQLGFYLPANGIAEFREFSISGEARTPGVSIVSCPGYENGAATTDLLEGSPAKFDVGAGVALADRTSPWTRGDGHGEFEWALVVRRFADGAVTNEEGDSFEFRMVEAGGSLLRSYVSPALRLAIPPGHVGGTFVEAPGRVGPWRASNGDLYFVMEPSETDNVFMMVKSSDDGRTWREVDGASRPSTNDLEAVDVRQVGDTLHIIHQVSESVRYHAFQSSDHPGDPDSWTLTDELAASTDSVAQAAALEVRSDGSMVGFYVGQTVDFSIRSPDGIWDEQTVSDPHGSSDSAGPRTVLGANDTVHLAYYRTDGTIWYRRLLPDGTLTDGQQLASGAGTTRAEYGAVLPLLYLPETDTVVILYRLADGYLWERRIVNDRSPTPPVRVSDRMVVRDAVDSQQPGADAVADGDTVHVLFIEEESRAIFSTHDRGGWQPSTLRVDDILGSWVRGNVYTRQDGIKVYGFVYDAGSDGGAGMNRFGEIELD